MKTLYLVVLELVQEKADEIRTGLLGMAASGGSFYISLSAVEQWLRLVSLVVGISVGLATFIALLRKGKKQ